MPSKFIIRCETKRHAVGGAKVVMAEDMNDALRQAKLIAAARGAQSAKVRPVKA